ncbi:MAG: hypothetical protein JO270_05990 [Acidobacteriaceae bacterium]|nr:hypothetical protein [Acidobacteriaceae bacterium]MBV8571654.1 hypothetical protein [Acidobacteriaceae bacterium]
MFERYTEEARRVIFFARHAASEFGSTSIEPEHLVLGVIRETPGVFTPVPQTSIEDFKRDIEAGIVRGPKIATSVDMPMTAAAKKCLAYATKEAERGDIKPEHLVIGAIVEGTSHAARVLRANGVTPDRMRESLGPAMDASAKNQDIVDGLKAQIARMAEALSPEIEPAIVFSLETPASSE